MSREVTDMLRRHAENAKLFKAFCDEKRLMIIQSLQGGEKCICYLMDEMNCGQSSISYHMKILCESGIVISRQDGKWTYYRLSEAGCQTALKVLESILTSS